MIWGSVGGGTPPFTVRDYDPLIAEEVEVRGQPAQQLNGSIEWIESDSLWVTISGPPIEELAEDFLLVAESLQPEVAPIPWGTVSPSFREPVTETLTPLLSGSLNETEWAVAIEPSGNFPLQLVVDGANFAELASRHASGGDLFISIDSVPGGAVIFADAPESVDEVVLRTDSGTAHIPAVAFGENRHAVGVPIDDALDPIALDFLATDGAVLHTLDLGELLPFGGSAANSSVLLEN